MLISRSVSYHIAPLCRVMRSRMDQSVAKLSGSPRLEWYVPLRGVAELSGPPRLAGYVPWHIKKPAETGVMTCFRHQLLRKAWMSHVLLPRLLLSDAGGDVDAPRSCARAIPLGVIGGANSRMRLSSPVTPPLVQDRKAGTLGKGRCLGGLQIDVDYREVSNYCSVAPLSPIAEEGGATPTYVTTPV